MIKWAAGRFYGQRANRLGMASLGAWLDALVHHWLAVLYGVPFAVLGVMERVRGKPLLERGLYVVAITVAFLVANFLVWNDGKSAETTAIAGEQTAQLQEGDLQSKLDYQEDYNTPNLQVSVQNVWMFPVGKLYELYMIVDVRNLGAPSLIDYWEVYIWDRFGRQVLLPTHRFDSPFSFPTSYGRMKYKPTYWLPDETYPAPIPRGGGTKGILICLFQSPDVKNFNLQTIHISFNDVRGVTDWSMVVPYTVNSAAVSPPELDR